jgi:putative nucleotidyltransferase with HDIG domain
MYEQKIIENQFIRSNVIERINHTLHERNLREEQHCQRVGELCQKIGRAIGLTELEVSKLKAIGVLHDIGKIVIEENVLNKKEKLSEQEWKQIKRHPDVGYRIIRSYFDMEELAEAILSHHERWDGKGYPRGLKGQAIPVTARIITLADSYDAMINERPYRKALTKQAALEEIQKNLGQQFDPEIARIFIDKVLSEE